LVWEPACSSASPQQYSGDSVTISYQSEICDIRVYNYDRVLQCQSSDYYVHQVSELVPAPLHIPADITVCPNSLIVWGDNEIPDQSNEGMLYEWTIQEDKQYCASVQGSHLSSSVTWAVNNIAPTTFYVKLTRTYCGGSVDTVINITVEGPAPHTLTINGPDTVCLNTECSFTGLCGDASTYRWEIEDAVCNGNPATHTFLHEGLRQVLLSENPYTYCTNPEYLNQAIHPVFVHPLPMVQGLTYDSQTNTIRVVPSPSPSSYTFSWMFRANAQSFDIHFLDETDYITPTSFGTYSCIVTDSETGCSKRVSMFYQGNFPGIQCNPMSLTGDYDFCSHSITLSAGYYNPFVNWHVSGGEYSIYKYGSGNRYADITFNNIGIYTVSASSGLDECYSGKRVITVNFIPEFSFKPACNKIEITNSSKYALPGENVYITVTNSCNDDEYTITMPASQTSYTYTPTGSIYAPCTYTFMLTGYGTNGNISQPCSLAVVTIGSPLLPVGVNPVTISTANPYSNNNTCDNTPIELTANLGYLGNIVSSNWSFGDASSYQIDGNTVFHTFESNNSYPVSVTITDDRGCTRTTSSPFMLTSFDNNLTPGFLDVQNNEVCPYVNTRNVLFTVNNIDNHYTWSTIPINGTNPHATNHSDIYSVYVVNNYYCQKEASTFVKFKNAPTAFIYAENFNCCVGNEITLYGEQGPGSEPLSYSWTITGPGGFSQTSSDPNVVFTAPRAGTFNVSLTITNTVSTCSSTATETITVNNRPSAPSIAFVGSPCISNAPVNLQATGYSGEVHWSNGNTGPNARYFTHGLASAYYDDPSVGCPSASATIRIHKQPDFDALLTGCYEKCKEFFTYDLPVYGLTDDMQSISWDWHLEGSSIATGSGNYTFSPVQLPIPASGNYQMFVSYSNNNCQATSPLLKISDKNTCDCDSIEITYKRQMHLKDCHLSYTVIVTVCNNSSTQNFCFDEIFLDGYAHEFVRLDRTHLDSMTIPPLGCDTFHISIDVLSLIPSAVNLKIIDDTCSNCEKEFSIDLKPEKIECEMEMHLDDYSIIPEFSSNVAAYFDFHMNVHPCQNLLAFWTEPPMVVDYWYDGPNLVRGLGMVDYATLTQLMGEEGKICFYAITCVGDKLCKRVYCITAREIYERLRAMGINPRNAVNDNGGSTKQSPGPDLGSNTDLRLMPNPTTGEVNVIGTADEVVEVLVMDMNGRKMATFDNTSTFDVSTLSSGVYIVRVKTRHDNTETITYLKLVKR
jgi:PKD repeat protein